MNTVNPDNFNETMEGYLRFALDFAMEHGANLTQEQIDLLMNGFRWARNDMTMEDARKYLYKKYND